MDNLFEAVTVLPGCGDKRSQALAMVGIRTVKDLLQYKGAAPPGVNNWTQLRLAAMQRANMMEEKETTVEQVVEPDMTDRHNWFGRTAHFLRKAGKGALRVTIGRLVVDPHFGGVMLEVRGGHPHARVRRCSPLLLAASNVLWIRRDIVSSDDENESPPFSVPQPSGLPQWEIDVWHDRPAVQFIKREVQRYQRHAVLSTLS